MGTPRVTVSATGEWLIDGYSEAVARLGAAADREGAAPQETFRPLFEALNWATSIEEYLRERGKPLDDPLIRAIRFARHRVHHKWALALEARDVPGSRSVDVTCGLRVTVSGITFDWFWKEAVALPSARNPQGEREYAELLAGKRARDALDALESLFRARAQDLRTDLR